MFEPIFRHTSGAKRACDPYKFKYRKGYKTVSVNNNDTNRSDPAVLLRNLRSRLLDALEEKRDPMPVDQAWNLVEKIAQHLVDGDQIANDEAKAFYATLAHDPEIESFFESVVIGFSVTSEDEINEAGQRMFEELQRIGVVNKSDSSQ